METILFGGNYCKITIEDYLHNLLRAIAVQVEQRLKLNKSEEDIKKEVFDMFLTEKFNFNFQEAEITETGGNRYEYRMKEGRRRQILVKFYKYIIPYQGPTEILKYRPTIFHEHDCTAKTTELKTSKAIEVIFSSEENFQEQFYHNKAQSIGALARNVIEANKDIDTWNKSLMNEINKIYPIVKAKYDQTIEFNRNNNIK
jgi:hypothetical protein